MRHHIHTLLVVATLVAGTGAGIGAGAAAPPLQSLPPALVEMADAERAFARRARATSVNAAFIEFFADEAVNFEPIPEARPPALQPVAARAELKKRSRPEPDPFQLLWEPRLGDVSAAGDLGYLTGPAQTVVVGRPTRHTNYFSVWKRQADGGFRVILDVGASTPGAPSYAPGLTRAAAIATWRRHDSQATAELGLMAADRAFSTAAAKDLLPAYTAALADDARLMRGGVLPLASRAAAVAWLRTNVTAFDATPERAESAQSGDLGYTWGPCTATAASGAVQTGYYVRVWTRQANGTWQVVAEVVTNAPPA